MSLTAGWKVELGIGDPAAIGDVGVYDTSRYASIALSGNWGWSSSANVAGGFRFNRASSALFVNRVDADGTDRSAEILGVAYPAVVVVNISSERYSLDVVSAVVSGSTDIRLDVSSGSIPAQFTGTPAVIEWFTGDPLARYGSDDLFGYLVDVTSRVEGLTTNRGRERFTSRFRTGTASVSVLNTDGAFTPPSGGGPIGILPLRPGRAVRITNNGADVFTGFVDSFTGYQGYDGKVSTTILCVDQFGQFTRNDLPAVTPEGAGDTVPQRMRRLLDRHIDDYTFTMMGTPEASMQATAMAQDLMSELALTADSEGGGVVIGEAARENDEFS